MLKLGTHNSMTNLKPTGLVQILAWNTGKCQNLSLEEQYEFGVRFLIFVFVLMKRQHLILLMAFWNFMKRQ